MKTIRFLLAAVATVGLASCASAVMGSPSIGSNIDNARYATDAYPGFDSEDEIVKPERKEPRWFSFINGPDRTNAADQFAYCQGLVNEGKYAKAAKQFDALVREWPTAPEAWQAQLKYAELLLDQLEDAEEAFAAYRYLLDFYSLQCDFSAIADKLYQVAGTLKLEGKEVMFVRFANTVDVRRAYETCVLRAPGATWVPDAMLIIASLREDEGKLAEAIQVYENLRNLHPESEEAKKAVGREADVRMRLLNEHEYNRARCRDTIDFLKMALRLCRPDDAERIRQHLGTAQALIEDEAYRGTKFYDSPTRTKRSAISAFEKFLAEYPQSVHAAEIRTRLDQLRGADEPQAEAAEGEEKKAEEQKGVEE